MIDRVQRDAIARHLCARLCRDDRTVRELTMIELLVDSIEHDAEELAFRPPPKLAIVKRSDIEPSGVPLDWDMSDVHAGEGG